MWLRGSTANQEWKENALIQNSDDIQYQSVLHMIQLEAISQQE